MLDRVIAELVTHRGDGGVQHLVVVAQHWDAAAIVHLAGHAKPLAHPGRQPLDRGFRGVARLRVQRADGAFDGARVGDDIVGRAALDAAHGHHHRHGRRNLARHHRLELRHQQRGGDDRVHRGVGPRGVARLAVHHDVEPVRCRQCRAADEAESACRHVGVVVEGQRHIDLRPVHHAFGDHLAHAADAFLGRLEHQLYRAGKLRRQVLQHLRHAEQGGGVDIVTAGVHEAGSGAGPGQAAGLLDRQSVHVGADGQHRAGAPALDQPDHPRLADLRLVRDAEPGQLLGDDAGGADLLEAELRVRVDIAPDLDQPLLDPLGEVADGGGGVVGQRLGHGTPDSWLFWIGAHHVGMAGAVQGGGE